jgi:endonuclease/exonuclease/phosphatase family metal-dependent hydrolase
MRIVSYNILNGGEGRADPIAEVVLAQKPDVVCLVEADDAAALERIGRRLKMDCVVASGGRDGVALLSRWPIIQSVDHALLRKEFTGSLLEGVVADDAGREWPIGVVHLSARATEADEQKREAELAVVLNVFARYRKAGCAHILAGDFNANSPVLKIDPHKCKAATQTAWENNGGKVPRRVVQRLLDEGYVDSLGAFDAGLAATAGSFTTQQPGQRVDYVFTFGVERVKGAWIEADRLARYASDHFPVGAEV